MDRTLTPGRAISLVLIALAALGLAYAKFGAGARHVTVPGGARAGQLTLHACHYNGFDAGCGTLVVPENRNAAHSRLIALPVTRVRARSAHPGTPVFRLEGGPGQTNFTFPAASWIVPDHDLVLVGYRGVDGSSRLDCPEVVSALEHGADLISAKTMHSYAAAYGDCAKRLRSHGTDLGGYSLSERVDDMEAARKALGYPRVDLISESAGTRTALIYAWRHPASLERSVMVGANPPGRFFWDPATTDAQIARYANLCAADEYCRSRTHDLEATMRKRIPSHWGPFPIQSGNVRLATFFGLTESTKAADPLASPTTFDTWLAGDASGFWFQSLMAKLTLPASDVWGDAASVAQVDRAAAARHFAGERDSILGDPFSHFLWGGGEILRYWPANHDDDQYARMRDTAVPTLVISGTNDFATPPQFAQHELIPHLRDGHQVFVGELGHTTDFWNHDKRAGARLVDTYLNSGRVTGYPHRAMDFHPPVRQTTLAKRAFALLFGLAALAVALFARTFRRRPFGRVGSAFLRSVGAVAIGIGAWCAAMLAAMIVAPAFPLDDGVLATLAAGVPVGIAIARVSRTPLPAALAGALLGASLAPTLLAAVGAVGGANLAAIAFEMLAARRPVRVA